MKKFHRYVRGLLGDYGIKSAQSAEEAETQIMSQFNIGEDYAKLPYYKKPANLYKEKDIRDWITSIMPIGNRQRFLKLFQQKNIVNGSKISEMSYLQFFAYIDYIHNQYEIKAEHQVTYLIHLRHFKWCYNHRNPVCRGFGTVLKKINRIFYMEEFYYLVNTVMLKKMNHLDEDDLQERCEQIYEYSKILMDQEKIIQKFNSFFIKKLKDIIPHFESENENEKEEDRPEPQQKTKKRFYPFQIKLIIIDQLSGGAKQNGNSLESQILQRRAKEFFSPLISFIPFLKQEFGIFHVGIQLGHERFYCEWTTASIIIIKPLETNSPVCTIDLPEIPIDESNYQNISKMIASIIYKWNTEKEYSLVHLNCQHFVLEMCRKLGIPKQKWMDLEEKGGAFQKFLSQIRTSGTADLIFQPSPSFIKTYYYNNNDDGDGDEKENDGRDNGDTSISFDGRSFLERQPTNNEGGKKVQFETHSELDEFCLRLIRNCKLQNKDPETTLFETPEWKLLSSWDECFWIKYFNATEKNSERTDFEKYQYLGAEQQQQQQQKIEKDEHHRKKDHILCPFFVGKQENEMFEKILKKNEEWNQDWYNQHNRNAYNEIMNLIQKNIGGSGGDQKNKKEEEEGEDDDESTKVDDKNNSPSDENEKKDDKGGE